MSKVSITVTLFKIRPDTHYSRRALEKFIGTPVKADQVEIGVITNTWILDEEWLMADIELREVGSYG